MDVFCVKRGGMGPEGARQFDPGRQFDARACAGDGREAGSKRPFDPRRQRGDVVDAGDVEQPPELAGELWRRGIARAVVGTVILGALRQLLGRGLQHLEEAVRRLGGCMPRPDLGDAGRRLVTEKRTIVAVFGPPGASQAAQVIGFRFGKVGGRQDRGSDAPPEAVAGKPLVADPRVLNELDAGLFIEMVAVADIPAHQCFAQRHRERNTGRAFARSVTVDQPHGRRIHRRRRSGTISGIMISRLSSTFSIQLLISCPVFDHRSPPRVSLSSSKWMKRG
ncbi:hypothetical protein WR25_06303 [Diploscapter pachys]|uniref:Uncharacterized protein n=1 Tax=Diploscapter pachys TaxID=2018661 RepID=A0A2A2M1S6_9BILA|nr:hypothetical protein WR25_06303 [Diploscapter pachys]